MLRHAKFFYIFLFLVIISFIGFYVGPLEQKENAALMEVDGKKVMLADYWRAYESMRNYYKNVYKEKFDTAMEKSLNIKKLTLDMMIKNEMLLAAAKRMGIIVSDDELNTSITSDQAFVRDGVFKKEVYLKVLELNRIKPGWYENMRRDDLIIQKTRRLIELAAAEDFKMPLDILGKDDKNRQLMENFRRTLQESKKDRLVDSYIESLKHLIDLKVHDDLIS
jgi:peptidyl-prolyl cis-trans isomerase D